MKRTTISFLFGITLFISACGGESEEKEESSPKGNLTIETEDIKGTLSAPEGASISPGTFTTTIDGETITIDQDIVHIGQNEIVVYKDPESWEKVREDFNILTSMGVEILQESDGFIFFSQKKVPHMSDSDEEKTGYGFILQKDVDGTPIRLQSHGDNPLDPIWDKDNAEKLLKVARSFKAD